jgi:ABC-type polysaccharide/polyol phosphate transport system ATPase subunit
MEFAVNRGDAATSPEPPQGALVVVRDVAKAYRLYDRPQDRLKHSLLWRFGKSYGRDFWALRDVSFQVRQGETLGIIGRNGSGKSTLLQIIAGTLQPTAGLVEVRGRVAAMLELGSGFNPEFTGRENVFMSGILLGLTQEEIGSRFDEIVAFADIGAFLDQPVKLYSSGMFLRLAFAVQVAVQPEVLIVDEALAVGDAGFQLRCYNRMRQLQERGTAIILVTHETQTVRSFCSRALWLHEGEVRADGPPLDVTSAYVQFLVDERTKAAAGEWLPTPASADADDDQAPTRNLLAAEGLIRWGTGQIRLTSATIDSGRPIARGDVVFEHGDLLRVDVEARAMTDVASEDVGFGFALRNLKGLDVITSTTYEESRRFPPLRAGQRLHVTFTLTNILAPGHYGLVLNIEDRTAGDYNYFDFVENALVFQVVSRKKIYSLVLPRVDQTAAVHPGPADGVS